MDEDVRLIGSNNESVAFACIEPFDFATFITCCRQQATTAGAARWSQMFVDLPIVWRLRIHLLRFALFLAGPQKGDAAVFAI